MARLPLLVIGFVLTLALWCCGGLPRRPPDAGTGDNTAGSAGGDAGSSGGAGGGMGGGNAGAGGGTATPCTQTLTLGSDLPSALANAAPGATLCLATGDWGSVALTGLLKADYVTVRSEAGLGAQVRPTITGGTQFLRLSSLTISGMDISGAATRHIAVLGSTFSQDGLFVNTTDFDSNDILIDGNTFAGTATAGFQEGRLSINWPGGPGTVPSGVTASHNVFRGAGCSDGIQLGSFGTVIGPGNFFTELPQGNCTQHVDAVQGYGQSHTVIRGNFFLRPRVCLGFYDTGDSELIEDNVFVGDGIDGTQCVIDLGSMTDTTFQHNTVRQVSARVGGINNSAGGSGTFTENILHDSSFSAGPLGACLACVMTHNLFSSGATGTNNLSGTPTYVGGALPTTWAGWQLTAASAGFHAALDGSDLGVRF